MLKRIALFGGVIIVLLMTSSSVQSQDKPAEAPDMMAMMKKWLATTSPGPQHKKLDYFVGNWDTTTKVWMAGPAAPPSETKGTSTVKWVLDGRFILEETDGQMLMPDESGQMKPRKHIGVGLHGYDVYRGMFIGTWADNLSTTILTMAGMVDPSGKVFTFFGEMDEPMLDVRARTVKYVWRIVDENHFVFEVFDLHAGPDYKAVQIDYIRKK